MFTVMTLIILAIIAIAMVLAIFGSCKLNSEIDDFEEEQKSLSGIVIAVDFDGTLAVTKYPEIIKPIETTINVIRDAKSKGAIIILWTCREGKELEEAINWCKMNNVPIDYVNENVPERIKAWGNDCRKIGADVYIDDKAINSYILKPIKNRKGD